MIDLSRLTISQAKEFLRQRCVSARELVEMYFEEIKNRNNELNAYLEVFKDAFEEAEKIDLRIKNGKELKFLEGIPFALKDNILIKGKRVSAGSKILDGYIASYDAFATRKLKEAGAIFLGRTNMDEFAMGSSTENSAFGPVKNPFDLKRVAGGSSGGSACAVAANMALAALGSDTGGSIRQPSAFCGVVGLKPTYGSISRSGLIAMASSLDQIGPIAKTVEDAEMIFKAIKGKDPKDATGVDRPERPLKEKIIVGVVKEFSSGGEGIDERILKQIESASRFLDSRNFEIKEVSLPSIAYSLACYYIIAPAEISANLARYDGVRYGKQRSGEFSFGKEAKRRIILGSYVLSAGYYDAYYGKASKIRRLIKTDFEKVFNEVDILMTPTAPGPAFKIGEKIENPLAMYLSDLYTIPVNLAGLPAMSLPFGKIDDLPVGVSLIAPWFGENLLFKMGKILENAG